MANKKGEIQRKTKKTPGNPPVEKKDEKPEGSVQVVDATPMLKQLKGNTSGLDINHQVDLLKMSHEIFKLDPDAEKKFGKELVESMNMATATGVVVTMATVATVENTPFASTIRVSCLPQILEAAQNVGIVINQKLLPKPAEDGTIAIPSTAVEVSKETKEKIMAEKAAAETTPELDPEKVAVLGEDALKAALTYLAVNKKGNLFQAYIDLYKFYHDYCYALARTAENAEEATKKFDGYTAADFFTAAFSHIEPTLLIGGIGKGMASVTLAENSPVHAYCILRDLSKKEQASAPTFTDSELADIAKGFMMAIINHNIAKLEEARDNAKALKEEKAFSDACANIERYQNTAAILNNPSFDVVEKLIENKNAGEANACRIYKAVQKCLYADATGTMCYDIKKHYKNMDENVKQYAGVITNMFTTPMNRITTYSENNIHELEEYTKEEWDALQKEKLAKKHEKNSDGGKEDAQ